MTSPSLPHPSADPDCLFCRIVSGEVPADVVAQDETAMAFADVHPQAPVHVLVIPRAHHPDVGSLARDDPDALVAVARMAAAVAGERSAGRFRLVFNSGAQAGQTVFHVHGHVLAGRQMSWPPG
ncbi:MAG: HIT domain-containing protein [Angustibacter sp.]